MSYHIRSENFLPSIFAIFLPIIFPLAGCDWEGGLGMYAGKELPIRFVQLLIRGVFQVNFLHSV
jgi:hypothetical protein